MFSLNMYLAYSDMYKPGIGWMADMLDVLRDCILMGPRKENWSRLMKKDILDSCL
jgi:hypothetical protein